MLRLLKTLAIPSAIPLSSAYPFLDKLERQLIPFLLPSSGEGNTGIQPSLDFDPKEQYVDVTPGNQYQYVAPGPADIRGPYPGLNAAATTIFYPTMVLPLSNKGTRRILL